jgi:hypothetical protein
MSILQNRAQRLAVLAAAALAAATLSSCGGGDPYTGLWLGSLDGNRAVSTILLGDGTYYMKYAGTGAPGSFGGVVRGTGGFHGATFTSTDGVDFHFAYPLQAPTPAAIDAKLGGHQTVTGSLNASALELTYDKPFDPDGKLADLAGSYPGNVTFSLGLRQTTFDVDANGNLHTILNGCTITGTAVPRPDDAFDLTLTFGYVACVFPGAVFKGAVVYSHDLQQLDAAVVGPYGQAITFTANKS